jgi:hypothetical protein
MRGGLPVDRLDLQKVLDDLEHTTRASIVRFCLTGRLMMLLTCVILNCAIVLFTR